MSIELHVDDSYGSCVICREWVPGTDDEHVTVAWPCAPALLDAARADAEAAMDHIAEVLRQAIASGDAARAREKALAGALEESGWEYAVMLGPGGERQVRICRLCSLQESAAHEDDCPFAVLAAHREAQP